MKNFLKAQIFFRRNEMIKNEPAVTRSNQGQEKGSLEGEGQPGLHLGGPSSTKRMHVPSWEGAREKAPSL